MSRIIELRSTNFKRLQAVRIIPRQNLVTLTGDNGEGKSSVLDSIWAAFGGAAAAPPVPIRVGEETADIAVLLDTGLKVTRRFRLMEDGTTATSLTVEQDTEDGVSQPMRSPQAMLDRIVGALTFDPLEFTRMKPRQQLEALRTLVPGVDFVAMDQEIEAAFDRRTSVNRLVQEFKIQTEAIDLTPDEMEATAPDIAVLGQELEEAGRQNRQADAIAREKDEGFRAAGRFSRDADELKGRATERRLAAAKMLQDADEDERREASCRADAQEAMDKAAKIEVPGTIDTAPILEKINAAKALRETINKREHRAELAAKWAEYQERADALTETIERLRSQKRTAIVQAADKMPVKGLGFGDFGYVTIDGVPFEQGSQAAQLRTSVAIAAAMNPDLRVIMVRDGSLLDEQSMGLLSEYADKHDLQVWIERVEDDSPSAILIENGKVARAAGTSGEPSQEEKTPRRKAARAAKAGKTAEQGGLL